MPKPFQYNVQPEDTPASIAQKFNLTTDQLLKANQGGYPFSTGQGIKIPKPTAPSLLQAAQNFMQNPLGAINLKPYVAAYNQLPTGRGVQQYPVPAGPPAPTGYKGPNAQGGYGNTYGPPAPVYGPPAPQQTQQGMGVIHSDWAASTNTSNYSSYAGPRHIPTYEPENVKYTLEQLVAAGEPVITMGDKALMSVYTPQQAIAEGWVYDPMTKTWSTQNAQSSRGTGEVTQFYNAHTGTTGWQSTKTGYYGYENRAGFNVVRNKKGSLIKSRARRDEEAARQSAQPQQQTAATYNTNLSQHASTG